MARPLRYPNRGRCCRSWRMLPASEPTLVASVTAASATVFFQLPTSNFHHDSNRRSDSYAANRRQDQTDHRHRYREDSGHVRRDLLAASDQFAACSGRYRFDSQSGWSLRVWCADRLRDDFADAHLSGTGWGRYQVFDELAAIELA